MMTRRYRSRARLLLVSILAALAIVSPYGAGGTTTGRHVALPAPTTLAGVDGPPGYLLQWGSGGTGNGQFQFAMYVAASPSGFVWVSDQSLDRVQKFDDTGNYLAKWGSLGSAEKQFENPWGLGVDSSDNVYVADNGNHRIQKFNSNGAFLLTWGYGVASGASTFEKCTGSCQAGSSGSGPGQLSTPLGLAVDSADNVFVASYSNSHVIKYDSNGNYLTQWGSSGNGEG